MKIKLSLLALLFMSVQAFAWDVDKMNTQIEGSNVIVNDIGEIIGTVSASLRGSQIGFAVPISYTKDMIKKAGFGSILGVK